MLTNFVTAMRTELFNGHSVNIEDFGVFSLSATTEGSDKREDCQADKIKSLRINFRASANVRPNLASTRAEDYIDFVDLESQLAAGEGGNEPGGSDGGGGDDGQDESPL